MQNQSANNKRIAKNTILLSIRMGFVLFLGLYTTRVTLNALGVDDFGIYNVVAGFVSMFVFLNTSMSNGIQRFFNFELGRNGIEGARKVYVMSLVIQFLLLIIILLLTETLGLWYLHNKMVIPADRFEAAQWVFQFSVLSFVFVIMQVPFNAAIMAHERMNYYAFIGVLDAILKLIIVLLIPFADCDLLILYSALIAGVSLLNFILAYTYTKKNFEEIGIKLLFEKGLFRSMLSFSGWNIFGTFAGMMREQGLNMILNLFFGPVVNAARGIAYQVSAGLQGFVSNVSIAIRPQIVQSYAQGDVTRTINLMHSQSKLSIIILYMLAYPIMLEIDFVLSLWLGTEIPEYTASFIRIVILISFVNNMNTSTSAVVHATGRMRKYQLTGCIINLSTLPVAYYALKLGCVPNSVFWITLVFTILMQTACFFVLRTLIAFSIRRYMRQVVFPFVLVIATSFSIPLLPYNCIEVGFLRFSIVTIVALLSTGFSFYFIGLNKQEKVMAKSMLLKLVRFLKLSSR